MHGVDMRKSKPSNHARNKKTEPHQIVRMHHIGLFFFKDTSYPPHHGDVDHVNRVPKKPDKHGMMLCVRIKKEVPWPAAINGKMCIGFHHISLGHGGNDDNVMPLMEQSFHGL